MDFKARIVARKIVFCYFFEQYFVWISGTKKHLLEEVEKISHSIDAEEGEKRNLGEIMNQAYFGHTDSEIAYIKKYFFDDGDEEKSEKKWTEPDRQFIKKLAPVFWQYESIVRDLVNTHATSFSFDHMDILDRVIFVMGYAERKEIGTPKEVVINEMIEFGKRYGDASSSKLINGIAHKLFNPEQAVDAEVMP